jgi:chemotaxis signal transduction protein
MLHLLLHAGPERLAVPAAAVAEVLPAVELHALPGGPEWVAGVFRRRGAVVPVVDVYRLVTGRPCPATLHARIALVEHPTAAGPKTLGLLAERVGDLRELPAGDGFVAPAPPDRPDLGPLAADADGVLRLTDPARLLPLAYQPALFAGGPA